MSNMPVLKPVDFNPFEDGKVIEKITFTNDSQREIWVSCIFGGEHANLSYNESVSLEFNGRFDFDCFSKAIKNLILRHEALRSTISPDGEKLIIYKNRSIEFVLQDITNLDDENQRPHLHSLIEKAVNTPLDLKDGPLLKILLHKLNENAHYLTIIKHHIIGDGWSTGIMLEDLSQMYNSYLKGEEVFLSRPYQISDYATEQARFKLSPAYQKTEAYWLSLYKDKIPLVDLPTDRPRLTPRSYNAKRIDYPLTGALLTQIKTTGAKAGASLVTTLLAAFEILLYSRTKQRDIVVGLPASGQSATGLNNVVGHCVNLLPLKTHVDPAQSFYGYLKKRKGQILDAYDHQRLTFGELIKKLYIQRDGSRVTLVPVIFNIDMGMDQAVCFDHLEHALFSNPRSYENFEIYLNASGSKNGILLEWSYNTDLFDQKSIESFHSEYTSILDKIVKNPEITIAVLTGLQNEQSLTLKPIINEYSTVDQIINELIQAAVKKYPEKTAVSFSNKSMSYQQLFEKTNQLASYLIHKGVKPGDTVGLCADRSIEMLVFLLGILKAGAAYIPLDPSYPQERIEFMVQDASTRVLIVNKTYQQKYDTEARELIIEDIWSQLDNFQKVSPIIKLGGNDLAYILYTSGSTGKPKGVKVTHHNLANFLISMQNEPGISASDSLLAITTISFDIAGLELYLPLISGAEVVIADQESTRDGRLLLNILKSKQITIMQATPSTWQMMIDAGWNRGDLSKVLCGGEAMPKDLSEKLMARCDELWNMYGPTETTIWSTIKHIKPTDGLLTIGLPINNTQIYIVDEQNKEVAIGVSGEILIGGDGVAAGYLNRPELSDEKFIRNIFSSHQGSKVYRTGDLGIRLANGEIQCLGRIDQQVKIRGHRIELGEIESILSAQDDVKQAVVIASEDGRSDKRLIGYVVLEDSSQIVDSLSWKDRWDTIYNMEVQSNGEHSSTEENIDSKFFKQLENSEDFLVQSEEWLRVSINRIKELKAEHVLEIGSGGGQLLFEIAPDTSSYIATDYAETAIDKLKQTINANPDRWRNVTARVCTADDFSDIGDAKFDLIIIHSVAQYFPDSSYFLKVIEESVQRINDGGCLFIGDMQGKNSLEMCHAMDHLPRSKDTTTLAEFKEIVQHRVKIEDEFTADPEFFYLLEALIPSITGVDVQLRRGRRLNETIKYHYDIWIYVNSKHKTEKPGLSLSWNDIKEVTKLEELLKTNKNKIFEIKNILNQRTAKDFNLYKWMYNNDEATDIKTIKNKLAAIDDGFDPELFWNLGVELSYHTHLRWSTDGTDGNFDVIYIPSQLTMVLPECTSGKSLLNRKLTDFARNPLNANQIHIPKTIIDSWVNNLKQHLPDYMVPVDYVVLKSFPLTPNNKIDKNALPRPQIKSNASPQSDLYELNKHEQTILSIWQTVLGLDHIGLDDDFFELGGHSLLAVKVMAAIEKQTEKRLPLAVLFENSTISKLAKKIELNEEEKLGALVPIKPTGSKAPIYLVHGAGLNILLFKFISGYLDEEQPVYGLQAAGLSKPSPLLYTIEEIAALYISEMIESDPDGPYCLTGYSSGGFIAFEMARQLLAMGREVKFVGIVDCYAGNNDKFASTRSVLARKIKRQFKKFPFVIKSFIKYPYETFSYQLNYIRYKLNYLKPNSFDGVNEHISQNEKDIYKSYNIAHRNYVLVPSDLKVSLFSVNKRLYYIDDPVYLGWKKFAKKGVEIMNIPGDHITMLAHPNDKEFARILQEALSRS